MIRVIFITSLVMLMLSGCTAMLNRQYVDIIPHGEQKHEAINPDAELRADSIAELERVILGLVANAEESATIRLYNYAGDPTADISTVCRNVMRKNPVGAYAVDYIEPKHIRIISVYELTVEITYRRTKEQIEAVENISSIREFEDKFSETLRGFEEKFAVQTNYYNEKIYDVNEILSRVYSRQPATALGLPSASVNVYPEEGWQRIIEVVFTYPESQAQLERKVAELSGAAHEIIDSVKTSDSEEICLAFLTALVNNCEYDEQTFELLAEKPEIYLTTDAFNAYGALRNRLAVSEGYAFAFKLLCDMADIDCEILTGRISGAAYSWNVVKIGGVNYHVDAAMTAAASENTDIREYFMKTDEEFLLTHKWEQEISP